MKGEETILRFSFRDDISTDALRIRVINKIITGIILYGFALYFHSPLLCIQFCFTSNIFKHGNYFYKI